MPIFNIRTAEEAKRIRNIFNNGGSFYRHDVTLLLDTMIWECETGKNRIIELEENIKNYEELQKLIKKLSKAVN